MPRNPTSRAKKVSTPVKKAIQDQSEGSESASAFRTTTEPPDLDFSLVSEEEADVAASESSPVKKARSKPKPKSKPNAKAKKGVTKKKKQATPTKASFANLVMEAVVGSHVKYSRSGVSHQKIWSYIEANHNVTEDKRTFVRKATQKLVESGQLVHVTSMSYKPAATATPQKVAATRANKPKLATPAKDAKKKKQTAKAPKATKGKKTPPGSPKRGRPAKKTTESPSKAAGEKQEQSASETNSPAKRGRPAKAAAKPTESPKKRGRPAKATTSTESPKKSVGRPKKGSK